MDSILTIINLFTRSASSKYPHNLDQQIPSLPKHTSTTPALESACDAAWTWSCTGPAAAAAPLGAAGRCAAQRVCPWPPLTPEDGNHCGCGDCLNFWGKSGVDAGQITDHCAGNG